tara:strand:+ start:508 stop:969 length:462 start_codon:yes stop_codon:yes gene_type:complete
VGCESSGANAFFVRKELAEGKLDTSTPEEAFYPCAPRLRTQSEDEQWNTVKENKFADVTMVKAGCSNEPGKTSCHVNPGFSPMSSMDATRDDESEEAEAELVKLSDHIHRPADLLKMDIEDAGYTYALHTHINIERRFTGVFQDVMIYAVIDG